MLTLILGPSGSGKSVRLREELRQRARSRQRSILIVPEQFTSSTEGARRCRPFRTRAAPCWCAALWMK